MAVAEHRHSSLIPITRQFIVLRSVHGLADGMLLPVKILMLNARGLTIAEVGLAMAAFSLTIALLELPTGGFADAWGRRRVLGLAGVLNLVGIVIFGFLAAPLLLVVGLILTGVARSLSSGPIEAWFIERAKDTDGDVDLSHGLGLGSSGENIGLAAGALVGGALPLIFGALPSNGTEPLLSLTPTFAVAAVIVAVELLAIVVLVRDRRSTGSLRAAVALVPETVGSGLQVAGGDRALRSILMRLFLAGVTLAAFDIFVPIRLVELGLSAGGAATLFGVLVTINAAGAAFTASLASRLKARSDTPLGIAGLLSAGSGVFGLLAALPAVAGVVIGFVGLRITSGPIMPIAGSEMHTHIEDRMRTTVISTLSLVAMMGAVLGSVALTQLPDRFGTTIPLLIGAVAAMAGGLSLFSARFAWPREEPDSAHR